MSLDGSVSGSTVSAAPSGFDLAALDAALSGTRFAGKLRLFPTIPSTNTHAMKEAESGAPEGMVYFADEQTAGRGRGAHAWASPPGSGLYVSALLRPRMAPADALWFSLAAGLAVHDAVKQVTSLEADLRWPNDLLLGHKGRSRKFCGILTELNAEATHVRHLVIGIGINVHQQRFPDELHNFATSLYIETGRDWPRQELLIALLQSLDVEATALTSSPTTAQANILARLEQVSSWVRGKHVYVEDQDGFEGVTEGLDPRGFLQIRTAGGLRTVFSGGVREQKTINR
ncbi:BirA family biotin operon repressor/biotin-[acetyl-CoA-carboxylase] ligase [Silvibacterium bohemicum]|uniref:biotin--[biotin carboxyl-carrier protein] ligase n=1 Tax=Silvibacterium bohemicum TaxID=1577686 RepID=A0A841K0G6_9BACT|nr:biotin--[acetyl-CoA-carboxylase] ligase [Silvibacterium bohemicum]MBB6147082.1 BirA family biotin operon repressor/biotin-[acetyl-CoA-carboxylase] ligase [Silvibacterium bohemicum]